MLEVAVTLTIFGAFFALAHILIECWDYLVAAREDLTDPGIDAEDRDALERIYLMDAFEKYAQQDAERRWAE